MPKKINRQETKLTKLNHSADPFNKEFTRLVARSGWTKSETARKLELTPAVITRYFNGETRPSLTTLKLFKLMVGDSTPLPGGTEKTPIAGAGYTPTAPWEEELLAELRKLDKASARKLAGRFCEMTSMLPRGRAAK